MEQSDRECEMRCLCIGTPFLPWDVECDVDTGTHFCTFEVSDFIRIGIVTV